MPPPAPPLFSITTFCPNVWDKWAARGRAAKSATPPGGNGTTSVIVRVGQGSCARSRSHPSQSPPEDKGSVNAYCRVDRDAGLRVASDSEARCLAGELRGLIYGVPVGVKDNVLVAGMPARFGSKLTSDALVSHDAPAVARLREQGAIIIGKTTMPEFGWKAVTDSPLTGVTRNPWDTRKTPGGSSGGAVAAVVLGMGNIHLGTDGGGSIRIPAAFAGSYGIKPTRARVPAWPASPLGTLAHVGCLT